MSLLVFSASNKIAQGVIRRLYGSGAYERIVCADVYPTYSSIQRFVEFNAELKKENSNTQISDIRIADKSDLAQAVSNASQVLYITHDYYSLVPSKLNLIKQVAELSKKSNKRLVALTPAEHDHYGEATPAETARASEKEAAQINPNLVHLKSDLTFGPDSTVAHSILTRLINRQPLGLSGEGTAKPIHSENVAEAVQAALRDESHQGKAYLLQGQESVRLSDYVNTLENYAGVTGASNPSSLLLSLGGPLAYFAERCFEPSYINLYRFFKQYREPSKDGFEGVQNLGISLKDFKSTYPQKGASEADFKLPGESFSGRRIRLFLD